MQSGTRLRVSALIFAAWAAAQAQSLIEPEHLDAARAAFDSAARAPHLRCMLHPVRPALSYDLQLQTGFVVDLPLTQFNGAGHSLNLFVRVTPEGRDAVYLGMSGSVTTAPGTDAEVHGNFVVGEGTYAAEMLVMDEAGRACMNQWRIQAKRAGSERDLKAVVPPGAVQELGAPAPAPGQGPRIERLDILLDAAATSPRAARLDPETIRTLADSLSSLLAQLPAQSVRLAVFNLDQQVVLLNKEPFLSRDLEEVTQALDRVQLATVDYKTLQNRERVDVLSDLVLKELHNPKPASAVIVMGPRSTARIDTSRAAAVPRAGVVPWFYLQYLAGRPSLRSGGWNSSDPDTAVRGRGGSVDTPAPIYMTPRQTLDGIERLVHRLNGATLTVRAPHDLADAVRRIAAEVHTVDGPAAGPVSQPAAPAPPLPAAAPQLSKPVEPAEPFDPVEVLARLRDRMLESARGIPNHTCVESVQRDRYEPYAGAATKSCDTVMAARKQNGNRLRLDLTDWLRLDVGMSDGREIFSWAGAAKFAEGEIDELIPEGAFGTGPFAAMVLSIFENRNPHFIFDGETTVNRRAVLEYSFQVPRDQSNYRVKAHREWIVTGYTGTLMVDPRTSDLLRFRVRTEELPSQTETCEVDTTLDYSMVPIGGFEYLLPKSTRQRFIGRDGAEDENNVTFASCREFLGESTLTFGGKPAGAEYFVNGSPAATLPAGLSLAVELTTPLTFGKAAAGDRIEGRLVEALHESGTLKPLAPAGARVVGRLMRVEWKHAGSGEYTVVLRWETLETGSATVPLNLKPNRQMANLKAAARSVLRSRGMEIDLPRTGEERDAIYHFPGQRAGVERGLRSDWVTLPGR